MNIATRYFLNQADELIFVDANWQRSALANDAPDLLPERVLRRPLWDFIADMVTRELYRKVLVRVRSGHVVQFPFRCDGPGVRRLLHMRIYLRRDQLVEFRTKQIRAEARPIALLLARSAVRSEEWLNMCGWCNQVHLEGTNWVEVEEAIARLRLFEQTTAPQLTHGICDRCHANMMAELTRRAANRSLPS
jgi:hypothetical protein